MAKLSYKVSYYIMYICFALILVVLGMFYFVGYNNPVGEYNAPEHTETLIYLMYAMFGKDAVWLIDRIFQATLGRNYSDHKHGRDIDLQIAPHVCKCTVYQGKLYDMGIGQIFYEQV